MTYKYTKGSFLRNKISGNIVKNNADTNTLDSNIWEIWTPKDGEWCWFWDKCTLHRPTLRQYGNFPDGYGEDNMFHDSENNPFDFCEPFCNSKPSHLGDL